MRVLILLLTSLGVLPVLAGCGNHVTKQELLVGAASSLLPALEELELLFEKESRTDLIITYSASGVIARQIEQGAPIDVFLSADQILTAGMARTGILLKDSIVTIGNGSLVGIRPQNGKTSRFVEANRIAIANPETAPYGAAAKRFLESNGIWDQVAGRVVYAESALQALQFVRTADADIGLVALSLVAQNHQGIERLPENSYRAFQAELIPQIGAITPGSDQVVAARRFLSFLTSGEAQDIFKRHGYTPQSSGHIEGVTE